MGVGQDVRFMRLELAARRITLDTPTGPCDAPGGRLSGGCCDNTHHSHVLDIDMILQTHATSGRDPGSGCYVPRHTDSTRGMHRISIGAEPLQMRLGSPVVCRTLRRPPRRGAVCGVRFDTTSSPAPTGADMAPAAEASPFWLELRRAA